jgi:hypothetical protein
MNAWDNGQSTMLVQDTEQTLLSFLTSKQGNISTEQRAKNFHRKMLRGEVRSAVRYLTGRQKGDVMLPEDIDEKTGDTVIEVLRSKHLEARTPSPNSLPSHHPLEDAIKGIARHLSSMSSTN